MRRLMMASVVLLTLQAGVGRAADSTATASPESTAAAAAPAAATAPAATPAVAAAPATASTAKTTAASGEQVVVLKTVLGSIVIRLHDKDAPKTTANFRKLVQSKFYDGTYFHRVIPGFMIQGGDPNTRNANPADDGIGGPNYNIPAEIKLPHLRGSVATARQGDSVNPKRESSGSQFFICLAAQPSLDRGGYTVFGEVISGMDAVDAIAALANQPGITQGASGPNPMKKALITRAWLAPLRDYLKPTAAAGDK